MSTASGPGTQAAGERSATVGPAGERVPSAPEQRARSSRSVADMFRSLAVVGAIVAVIFVMNPPPDQDPVREIDPAPVAASVAQVAPFPVLLPTDLGWRATSARWEPSEESGDEPVWSTGGVYGPDGPFASVSQSTVDSPAYLTEQTGEGAATLDVTAIGGVQWQRYESPDGRSLVRVADGATTVVSGSGGWDDLKRFAASLEPVTAPAAGAS